MANNEKPQFSGQLTIKKGDDYVAVGNIKLWRGAYDKTKKTPQYKGYIMIFCERINQIDADEYGNVTLRVALWDNLFKPTEQKPAPEAKQQ